MPGITWYYSIKLTDKESHEMKTTPNSETVRNGETEISMRLYVCCHINIIKRAHKIVHNFRKTTAFKIGLGDQKGKGHLNSI